MSASTAFLGSVPKSYHEYMVPMLFEPYARDMVKRAALKAGDRVLELACGTGIVTRMLAEAAPGATILATDLNLAMVDVARVEAAAPSITYDVANACSLPFADASFDVLVCQYGVMFFEDKVGAMKEARRVLKPGGRYIFNVWDSLERNPMPRTVQETLTKLYPANTPMFIPKAPFGWSDPQECERVTRAGGFTDVAIEHVEFPCRSRSAVDAARGWIEGTPVRGQLDERGVKDAAPVREAVAAALAAKFGAEPCVSTMRAMVVTAR